MYYNNKVGTRERGKPGKFLCGGGGGGPLLPVSGGGGGGNDSVAPVAVAVLSLPAAAAAAAAWLLFAGGGDGPGCSFKRQLAPSPDCSLAAAAAAAAVIFTAGDSARSGWRATDIIIAPYAAVARANTIHTNGGVVYYNIVLVVNVTAAVKGIETAVFCLYPTHWIEEIYTCFISYRSVWPNDKNSAKWFLNFSSSLY